MKEHPAALVFSFLLGLGLSCSPEPSAPVPGADGEASSGQGVRLEAHPFPLSQIRLLESPFQKAMERTRAYLKTFSTAELAHLFRVNSGLPSAAQPLGGWESLEVRGHFVGHYLTACALQYAAAGDEELKARADELVSILAECQKASRGGYLSAFPEEFFDRLEARTRVWAPWYTLHKVYQGLLDMYLHAGNEQALEVLKRAADWAYQRTGRLSREQMQEILESEFGGMNDLFAALYQLTRDPRHLELARRFDHGRIFQPLAEGRDELMGLHANTQIPKFVGAAREYEVTGDPFYRRIATFSWETITGGRTFATGGTGNYEHWRTPPGELASELGAWSAETCCAYNMLKLTRHLFTWNPEARYADYFERTLYNAILASQDPETGMMLYFCSLQPGHWKVYNQPRDAFWCCTGTGVENHSRYGEGIYFHGADTLFVNLFIPSELHWEEQGVRLRQETRFPEEETTRLTFLHPQPVELELRVRIPSWTEGATVRINGEAQAVETPPSSYWSLRRSWKEGDRVEVVLPMKFQLAPLPDGYNNIAAMQDLNPRRNYNVLYHAQKPHRYELNLAAILYGPLVLAGELEGERLAPEQLFVTDQTSQNQGPFVDPPDLLVADWDPNRWIEPVPGSPLTFRTAGVGRPQDVTLVPFYRVRDRHYTVYWILIRKLHPEAKYLQSYND